MSTMFEIQIAELAETDKVEERDDRKDPSKS